MKGYTGPMNWVVIFDDAFAADFATFPRDAQTALLAKARLLESFGPQLGRPLMWTR